MLQLRVSVLSAGTANWSAELSPVSENRGYKLPTTRTVLQRMEFDRHLVAGFDGIRTPSACHVLLNGLHLESPFPRNALVVRSDQVNPDMRIGPFVFLHHARYGDVF